MSGNMFSELIGLMQNDISPDEIYTEVCTMIEKKNPLSIRYFICI